jgi:hypothetical protein
MTPTPPPAIVASPAPRPSPSLAPLPTPTAKPMVAAKVHHGIAGLVDNLAGYWRIFTFAVRNK